MNPNAVKHLVLFVLCCIGAILFGSILASQDYEDLLLLSYVVVGIYVLAAPLLNRLWPDLKMTPEQVDRIADHVTEFSLAYLRQARSSQQQSTKAVVRRNRK